VAGDPASAQVDPAISGNLVVWEDRRDGNLEIYARDLGGGPAIRLTETADTDELDPAVSGSRVVYSRRYADGGCQIFMTDVVTRMTRQITSGPGCFSRPDIDGDTIVYDNNPSGDQDVYVYNLATGIEHRVVLAGVQRNAHVSGDWLSAEKIAQLPYPNLDVKIYSIPRDAPFGAVTTEFDEQADDISGMRVAYQTNQNHNLDIGVVEFQLVSGRNRLPVADAGPDQALECASAAGTPMALDGSASFDPDDDPITYTWTGPFPENGGLVPGAKPAVTLPLGLSTVRLVVNDAQEDSAPDTMTASVSLRVQGLGAPLAALAPEGTAAPLPAREFKQGSTLPLKLVLFCGAETLEADDVAAPEIVAIDSAAGGIDPSKLDLDSGKSNGGGLRFRSSEGGWTYNLSTRSLRPDAYTIWIRMPDGRLYSAAIVLK
jgi:beta propeller repeat protein